MVKKEYATTFEEIKDIIRMIKSVDVAIRSNPMEIGNLVIRFQLQERLIKLERELGYNPSFDM